MKGNETGGEREENERKGSVRVLHEGLQAREETTTEVASGADFMSGLQGSGNLTGTQEMNGKGSRRELIAYTFECHYLTTYLQHPN